MGHGVRKQTGCLPWLPCLCALGVKVHGDGGEWEGLSESKSVVGAMEGELFAEESNKRGI